MPKPRLSNVKVGANVIETLTMGMYQDPMFIYREYIQNAADQIDVAVSESTLAGRKDGEISISVNRQKATIEVSDNATGIPAREVGRFLGDVANSDKDPNTSKGFRGIGRLGGLGYCETLVFETSAQGETEKSILTLDAKKLRRIIYESKRKLEASQVISVISSIKQGPETAEKHYFKVTLIGVTNSHLLDVDAVMEYLALVAPVEFAEDFRFADEIHQFFTEQHKPLDVYDIKLNGRQVIKAYSDSLRDRHGNPVQLLAVDALAIESGSEGSIALLWYGVTDTLNSAIAKENQARGIRVRKGNITIGDGRTLNRLFDRFNNHFIGELHVFGPIFRPNARRDYFNDSPQLQIFEHKLLEIFKQFEKLSRNSSDIRNRYKDIQNYFEGVREFNAKSESKEYKSEKAFDAAKSNLALLEDKAHTARKKLTKIQGDFEKLSATKLVFNKIVGEGDVPIDTSVDEEIFSSPESFEIDQRLEGLNRELRKAMSDVFSVLDSELRFTFNVQRIDRLKIKMLDKLSGR